MIPQYAQLHPYVVYSNGAQPSIKLPDGALAWTGGHGAGFRYARTWGHRGGRSWARCEPRRGQYDFSGYLSEVEKAKAQGQIVIIRPPGPVQNHGVRVAPDFLRFHPANSVILDMRLDANRTAQKDLWFALSKVLPKHVLLDYCGKGYSNEPNGNMPYTKFYTREEWRDLERWMLRTQIEIFGAERMILALGLRHDSLLEGVQAGARAWGQDGFMSCNGANPDGPIENLYGKEREYESVRRDPVLGAALMGESSFGRAETWYWTRRWDDFVMGGGPDDDPDVGKSTEYIMLKATKRYGVTAYGNMSQTFDQGPNAAHEVELAHRFAREVWPTYGPERLERYLSHAWDLDDDAGVVPPQKSLVVVEGGHLISAVQTPTNQWTGKTGQREFSGDPWRVVAVPEGGMVNNEQVSIEVEGDAYGGDLDFQFNYARDHVSFRTVNPKIIVRFDVIEEHPILPPDDSRDEVLRMIVSRVERAEKQLDALREEQARNAAADEAEAAETAQHLNTLDARLDRIADAATG